MLAFVATLALFGVCASYMELRARDANDSVDALASVNLPAISRLAAVRTELREIQTMLVEAVEGQTWGRGALQRARANLMAEWRQFAASGPTAADVAPASHALDEFDAAVEQVRGYLLANDVTRARVLLQSRLVQAGSLADRALADLLEVQMHETRRVASWTADRGRRTTLVALVLDGVSIALAGALALLAIRATRKNAILLEGRASELEQFADRLAHDIGNPLTSVLLALEKGETDTRSNERLHALMERGLRSIRIVTDIVHDLHGFARGGAEPDLSAKTGIRRVVDDVVMQLARDAEANRIELRVEPFEDAEVRAGAGVLACIMTNLVRNAIVHMGDAERRRIVIRAHCAVDLRIEVEDTGPGVPAYLVDRIFEPRFRGTTRGHGLGLGLATVRRLAEAYGGAAGVESRPGRGSTFWVKLPRAEAAGDR